MAAPRFAITLFSHVSARFKEEQQITMPELGILFAHTKAPSKDQLPLIKLARFGNLTTSKGSLRHDANMIAVSGIECDYDGGKISLDEAVQILGNNHVKAFLYTSPSHTLEHPRWRIIAPFSCELHPSERSRMVARINGLFGGALAPESFTQSQSYYFGHVDGVATQVGFVK